LIFKLDYFGRGHRKHVDENFGRGRPKQAWTPEAVVAWMSEAVGGFGELAFQLFSFCSTRVLS